MRVIVCNTYEEISECAARIVAGQIYIKPDCVLGLATGSTPVGMYNRLAMQFENGELNFEKVSTFNLDEYYPIPAENDQSYHYFMQENLFGKINVKPENIHILDGEAKDPEAECKSFDETIDAFGGIDLQILGIGRNGHIGFNEPDDALITGTHITGLTESTIEANARFFESIDDVPKQALTMGIVSILKAKKILLLASGKDKREAVSALLTDEITTKVPATMLKVHPDVVLICDKEAYGDVD